MTNWSAGEVMVTCGGVVSRVTVMLALPDKPPADVAVAVRMFGPSASGTDAVKIPFATGAVIELINDGGFRIAYRTGYGSWGDV